MKSAAVFGLSNVRSRPKIQKAAERVSCRSPAISELVTQPELDLTVVCPGAGHLSKVTIAQ